MNVDDILEGGEETPEDEDEGLPVLPFSISVGEVGIRDGMISVMDSTEPDVTYEYLLDRLNCKVRDITWPIVQPLSVSFNFHIAMRQLGAEEGKTFSLVPGLTGSILLKYINDAFIPEGRIDFYATDGEFFGQRLLEEGQNFLDELKRGFFNEISAASVGNLDEFERALLDKTGTFANEATKQINVLVENAQKDLASLTERLESLKLLAANDMNSGAQKENSALGSDAARLTENTKIAYNSVIRVYPAAASKININTYIDQAQAKVSGVQEEYGAFAAKQIEEFNTEITDIIENEQKKQTAYINNLQEGVDAPLARYAASVRNQFTTQIGRAENFVGSYDLDIPLLRRQMEFNRISTLLTVTNGLMHLQDLIIHGNDFSVGAGGNYNLINDDINVEAKLILDTRYAANTILSLFQNSEGAPELEFVIATKNGEFYFELVGDSIAKRIGNLATDKAKEYMLSYINKNVSLDRFLASLGDRQGDKPETAIDAAKGKHLNILSAKKTQYTQSLLDEGNVIKKRIEDDAKKAVAGNINLPNIKF
jgi:hypothetical protein